MSNSTLQSVLDSFNAREQQQIEERQRMERTDLVISSSSSSSPPSSSSSSSSSSSLSSSSSSTHPLQIYTVKLENLRRAMLTVEEKDCHYLYTSVSAPILVSYFS
jgi:hypothetical protein